MWRVEQVKEQNRDFEQIRALYERVFPSAQDFTVIFSQI